MSTLANRFSGLRITLLVIALALVIGLSAVLSIAGNSYLYLGLGLLSIPILLWWIKYPVWALCFLTFICFIPQGLIPLGMYDYVYRFLAVLVLLMWLFTLIAHRQRLILPTTTILMLCFLLFSCLTLLWTTNVNIGVSFLQIYFVRFIIFLIVVPNLIRTITNLDRYMASLAMSAWVIVIAALVTVFISGYSPGVRLKVYGENENGLGIHILVTMVGVIWIGVLSEKRKWQLGKWLAFGYILAAIGVVAASGSRGSAISLAVAFLAFWLWKTTRVFGRVSLVYLVLIAISIPLLFQTIIDRFTMFDQVNTLFGGREALWSAAWTAIKNDPWLGVGLGNSNYVMLSYLQDYRSALGLEYAPVHNPLLTIWMETGLPGLAFYFGSLVTAIVSFVKQYLKDRRAQTSIFMTYYAIVTSIFLGYMLSWIKGGGIESDATYFLMLSLLILPASGILEQRPLITR